MQRVRDRRDRPGLTDWQLAEAKNKFSEVYCRAVTEGRQRITKRGAEPVYVISESELDSIEGKKPNFIEFLMNGPDFSELNLERDQSLPGDVDLCESCSTRTSSRSLENQMANLAFERLSKGWRRMTRFSASSRWVK